MGSKEVIFAIASLVIGGGVGYFWSMTRPGDGIEMVAGISVIAIVLVYFSLHSMSKH